MVVSARFFFRFFVWAIAVIVALGGLGLAVGCSSDDDGASVGNKDEGAIDIEVVGPEGTKATRARSSRKCRSPKVTGGSRAPRGASPRRCRPKSEL